jgi:hypothetical protein
VQPYGPYPFSPGSALRLLDVPSVRLSRRALIQAKNGNGKSTYGLIRGSLSDVIPVRLVVATALMAISRKVIIFDYDQLEPLYVFATAAVVLALGITYWLITRKN